MSTPGDQIMEPAALRLPGAQSTDQMLSGVMADTSAMDQISADQAQSIQNTEQQVQNAPIPQGGHGAMHSMPLLLSLAAIGGKLSGLHGRVMLGALSGMAKGALQGDEQAFKDNMERYNASRQKLMDLSALQNQYYETFYNAYGRTAEAQMQAIMMARELTNDQWTKNYDLAKLKMSSQSQWIAQQRLQAEINNWDSNKAFHGLELQLQEMKLQQTAQQMNLDGRGQAILGELKFLYPQAASGFGFGTRNMIMTIQAIENAPDTKDLTPQDIAKRLGQNFLNYRTAEFGTTVVGRREGATLPAINALVQNGGVLDQAIDVARKLGFGNDKIKNAAIMKSQSVIGNPLVAQYKQYMASVQAEWGQVLSRGGLTTDRVREDVENAASGNTSMEELIGFKTSMPREANSILQGASTAGTQLFQETSGEQVNVGADTGSVIPTITTQEQYDSLKPGAPYYDSAGNKHIKKKQ